MKSPRGAHSVPCFMYRIALRYGYILTAPISSTEKTTMNDQTKTVADLDEDLTLVTDAYEIETVLDHLGYGGRGRYGCLFVGTENGDYTDVYGVTHAVAYKNARTVDLLATVIA